MLGRQDVRRRVAALQNRQDLKEQSKHPKNNSDLKEPIANRQTKPIIQLNQNSKIKHSKLPTNPSIMHISTSRSDILIIYFTYLPKDHRSLSFYNTFIIDHNKLTYHFFAVFFSALPYSLEEDGFSFSMLPLF